MFEKRFTPNIYSCIMKEMMEVKEMELRQGLSIQENCGFWQMRQSMMLRVRQVVWTERV